MMTSYEALHFGDIHFTPLWQTLNMQWVSLAYLKSLVADNSFQPEGVKLDAYSNTTAICIVFLSNEEHQGIEHVHIGLVVHWAPDSTSSKKSSCQGKCSPLAKEWLDSCDTDDHHTSSSKHKDRSCSDKSSRHSSDKESSSTPCKCAQSSPPCTGSAECPWKEPDVDGPSHIPGESSCTNYRSPSRSMSEPRTQQQY